MRATGIGATDAECMAGAENLDDDDLGIMIVASREAEMRAEALWPWSTMQRIA